MPDDQTPVVGLGQDEQGTDHDKETNDDQAGTRAIQATGDQTDQTDKADKADQSDQADNDGEQNDATEQAHGQDTNETPEAAPTK